MNTHEQLGLIIDRCDNYLAAQTLNLPDSMHVEGLTGGIKSIKADLELLKSHLDIASDRQIYADAGINELINKSVVKDSFTTETNASKEG